MADIFSFFPSSPLCLHPFLSHCYFDRESLVFLFVYLWYTLVKCLLNVILTKYILHSCGTYMNIFSFNSHNSTIFRKNYFLHFADGKLSLRGKKVPDSNQQLLNNWIAIIMAHLPILTNFKCHKIRIRYLLNLWQTYGIILLPANTLFPSDSLLFIFCLHGLTEHQHLFMLDISIVRLSLSNYNPLKHKLKKFRIF